MSKFLEIKTELSVRRIRDILWNVHKVHIIDNLTKKNIILQSNVEEFNKSSLAKIFCHTKWHKSGLIIFPASSAILATNCI